MMLYVSVIKSLSKQKRINNFNILDIGIPLWYTGVSYKKERYVKWKKQKNYKKKLKKH